MSIIIDNIAQINPLVAIFILSMFPFFELRGGILLGMALGLPWLKVFIICLIGNILPIPFVIIFGRYVISLLERASLFGKYIRAYKRKLISKSSTIKKYGPLGLILFVGIPLPGTGAWSGAVLALLLDLRMKRAIPCIFTGIFLAGVLMILGSLGLNALWLTIA